MMEFGRRTRSKVVAEITVAHLRAFAAEVGCKLASDEAVALLNRGELAQQMWMQMMHAAEEYAKAALERGSGAV